MWHLPRPGFESMFPHRQAESYPLYHQGHSLIFPSYEDVTVVKNQTANAGIARDTGLIPGSGRSPGVGNGNPLQYCCLEKSMDRGAWQATAHGVAKSQHNWAAEHKQGPTLIQIEFISKSTITCTKIVFPNQVLFVGSGGYNLGIPLGPLLNLLWSGKKKKKNKCDE